MQISAIINDKWKDDNRYAEFIPPNHLKDIQGMPESAKRKWLADKLHLKDALDGEKMSKSVQDMDGDDRKAIVTIVSTKLTQYTNDSVKGWDALLKEAGLDLIAGELDLKGSPKGIAGQLVDYLQTRAPLPEKPQHEVLGLLLLQLLKEVTPAEGDYETIEKIIRKYGLVPESEPLPKRKI